MLWLTVFQFGLIAAIVVYLTVNMLHLDKVEPISGPLSESPFVTVCVPARNEERDIGTCLESLLSQDYPNYEVVVVDDNSTDRTWEIIRKLADHHPRLIALKGQPLPSDWYGKPYALHQAVHAGRGQVLVFTDADPVFEPHALTSAIHTLKSRKVDLLSLMPRAEFGSFWERAVQPIIFGFIAAKTRFQKVNSPEFPDDAMGFGAFIMMRRETYERIGGHERLRQAILEDIGMARLAKSEGARCWVADAKPLFSIRMYHSLGEIWRGWRKNIFLAFRRSILRTLYYSGILICFLFTPYLLTGYHIVMGSHWLLIALSFAGLVLVWAAGAGLCYELRLPLRTQLLFPIGVWVAAAVMVNSMVFILGAGKSEWRGRTYAKPT